MDILIGGDPEFFVKSKETGKLVSAHGLIEGTKKNPMPMGGGHAQVDGMALEINIPPSKTADEFWDGFNNVMDALKRELPKYEFVFQPVAEFGKELIDAQPLAARELGCEPDYSAHTGKVNVPPNADAPFRTASGHIHIGWTDGQDVNDPDHMEACNMLSKQLDTAIGFPSLLWDDDTVRRTLYGKAGCFRPKHYGMEYRTLSNVWLTDKALVDFVFGNTVQAFNHLVEQVNYQCSKANTVFLEKGMWSEAASLYARHGLAFPKVINDLYVKKMREKELANAAAMDKLVDKERNKLLKKNGHIVGKENFQIDVNNIAMNAWKVLQHRGQVLFVDDIGIQKAADVGWAWGAVPPAPHMPAAVPILDDFEDILRDLQEEEDF